VIVVRGTESGLTKAIAIVAMTCLLIAGAAATSLLGRDHLSAATAEVAPPAPQTPVSNKEAKNDRLAVGNVTLASAEAAPTLNPTESLRQAFASSAPADVEAVQVTAAVASQVAPTKPKPVARPAPQKPYALLSDAQIAGIKQRLKLSSAQEYYWPAVENALRAVARKIHATRRVDPGAAGAPPIDPEAAEVQQLKSAAMPLLFQLREDQKQEVRTLARLIGLEKVAAQI
jgi:hypothetical protein